MSYKNLWVLNFAANGAIVDKTFVELSTQGKVATSTWSGFVLGVSNQDAADTQSVWIDTVWVIEIVVWAAIAVWDKLKPTTGWKAAVATSWQAYYAVAITPATAANEIISAFLVRGTV